MSAERAVSRRGSLKHAGVCMLAMLVANTAAAGVVPGSRAQPVPRTHRSKPLKVLPPLKSAPAAAPSGPTSPYARAAERRDQSGAVPPGHAHVSRPPAPVQPAVQVGA